MQSKNKELTTYCLDTKQLIFFTEHLAHVQFKKKLNFSFRNFS